MSKKVLDEIQDNSEISSVEYVDSEYLRLDKKPSPKKLFYEIDEDEDDDEKNTNNEVPDQRENHLGGQQPVEEFIDIKKVRFKRRQRDPGSDIDFSNVRYWDFGPLVHQEFRDRLPSNYEIKRWKRPSKHIITSVIQLLETNFETAIQQVLNKYSDELKSAVDDSRSVLREKHIIMHDLILKIRHHLKRTKFPSRISDRDMDIEYVVSKRKYIQSRYAQELMNAEKLEDELVKEEQKLEELRGLCQDLEINNKKKLQDQLSRNDLHPSLMKAMENAYGLIPDSDQGGQNHNKYINDLQEFQLVTTGRELWKKNTFEIEKLLPAVREYNKVSESIYENINKFMRLNRIELIQSKLDEKINKDNGE